MVELAPGAPGHRPPPADPSGRPLVELRGLTTGYERTAALRGVDFTLRRGEFAGVVGPSGSGKSTLLRAIAGQTRRFAGTIETHPRAKASGSCGWATCPRWRRLTGTSR